MKYGEGSGEQLISHLENCSIYSMPYRSLSIKKQKEDNNKRIQELEEAVMLGLTPKHYEQYIYVKNAEEMLKKFDDWEPDLRKQMENDILEMKTKLPQWIEKDKEFIGETKKLLEKRKTSYKDAFLKNEVIVLEEFENFVLECIEKDIDEIGNVEQAKKELKRWHNYKKETLVDTVNMPENIQNKLTNKCLEFDVFRKDILGEDAVKTIGNVIDSDVYDMQSIKIYRDENNCYVYDKYNSGSKFYTDKSGQVSNHISKHSINEEDIKEIDLKATKVIDSNVVIDNNLRR